LVGGSPFLPDRQRAASDWGKLKDKVQNRRTTYDPIPWDQTWIEALEPKYRAQGYRFKCPIGSGGAKKCLDLLWDLLPGPVRHAVLAVFTDLSLIGEQDNSLLLPILKELGDLAKNHGDRLFNGYWHHLVNWELCFGAPPESKEAKIKFGNQIQDWLSEPKEEDDLEHPRTKMILRGLDLLDKRIPRMVSQRDARTWASDPDSWLVNGASTEPGLPGTRGNKLSTFLARGVEGTIADLEDDSDPEYIAMVKRERGKLRNIVNSPWSLYLQQKFLADGMEHHIFKYIPSSLSKDFGIEWWEKWRSQLGPRVPLPIDQTGFDHVPGAAVIARTVEMMTDKCALNCPARCKVIDRVRKRMKTGTAQYEDTIYTYLRGIVSGWEWTSKMDTIISYAEALAIFEEAGVSMPDDTLQCYQGDDAIQFLRGWGDVLAVAEKYSGLLPVNPSKFFVDTTRTEYLRLVLTPQRRFGYLARAVPSLVFANAWQAGNIDDPNALVESWSRIYGRGADPGACVHHMVTDVSNYLRTPKQDTLDWILTPRAAGGGGMVGASGHGSKWMSLKRSVPVTTAYDKQVEVVKYSSLNPSARSQVAVTARQLVPDAFSEGYSGAHKIKESVYEHLCSGLVLTKKLKRQTPKGRYYLERCDVRAYTHMCDGLRSGRRISGGATPPRILYVGVRSLCQAAIAGMTHFEDALRLIDGSCRLRATVYYNVWPRKTWWQWASGKLAEPSCSGWGVASDVSSWAKRQLRAVGSWPPGRPSQERILQHHLALEMYAHVHLLPQFAHMRG
jgi:hypothetical protein